MTHLTTYFMKLGLDSNVSLLLDGGLMLLIVLLMIFSKTVIDFIEEGSGVFGFVAFFVLGLFPWLFFWAVLEASIRVRERNESKKRLNANKDLEELLKQATRKPTKESDDSDKKYI